MSKGYIKIIFSLLISSVYMSNKTFAAEANSDIEALRKFARPPNIRSIFPNDYSEGAIEEQSFNSCVYPQEIEIAEKVMNEAERLLQYHAESTDDYKLYHKFSKDSIAYYKKHGNTLIFKFNHKIKYPDKYNYIISILWNSNAKYVGGQIVKEKVARAYSPNLMMIQQRYKNDAISFHGYYYALAKKVQVSDDTTIIVYASSDVNDYNSVNKKKYTNTILESANSFKPKIYSEKDIRNGELTRMFVNLSGFIIQKKGIALILPISTLLILIPLFLKIY
ncbi:fam-a protein [Plasmodium berghei]|uniref:Fam-a protein n=3 Tax=Plasmodium berghei TaxID=5821 RepID=A0A509AKE8_PLABA|nr:fam-a protein [Plasmodium berghei ANKA]XP_034421799.1 fam-a protein [Plasmodium berghei ANKA]SBW38249.1 fam-a protein [Plasmodium berghei]VUC54414.1 fam-a protein [Plasmodium berghei ANKA]VUC55993.1 fam-a protein [Plasmodium berghei ANKA]|eukprot:XP_034420245.1 fam-a protein [Plasmodium berghei ANKA]